MPTFTRKLAVFGVLLALVVCSQAGLYRVNAQEGTDDIVYTRADLENYIGKWQRRDGAAAAIISDYFCQFFLSEPRLFLEVMSEHPRSYDAWLKNLPALSLTDTGGCTNVECIRTLMLGSLDLVDIADLPKRLQPMADRLKEVLKKTKIRHID